MKSAKQQWLPANTERRPNDMYAGQGRSGQSYTVRPCHIGATEQGDTVLDTHPPQGQCRPVVGVDDAQEGITPIRNAEDGGTVGIGVDSGTITDLTAVPSSTIPLPVSPDLPLQYGLFSFRIQGLPVDAANPASVRISFTVPPSSVTLERWYKYDQVTGKVTDISSAMKVDGRTAVVTITDGSAEDGDGVVNGIIIDPSGPAFKTVVDSVATGSSPVVPGSQVNNTDNTTNGGGSGLWLVTAGLLAALGRLWTRRELTARETARSDGSAGTAA